MSRGRVTSIMARTSVDATSVARISRFRSTLKAGAPHFADVGNIPATLGAVVDIGGGAVESEGGAGPCILVRSGEYASDAENLRRSSTAIVVEDSVSESCTDPSKTAFRMYHLSRAGVAAPAATQSTRMPQALSCASSMVRFTGWS